MTAAVMCESRQGRKQTLSCVVLLALEGHTSGGQLLVNDRLAGVHLCTQICCVAGFAEPRGAELAGGSAACASCRQLHPVGQAAGPGCLQIRPLQAAGERGAADAVQPDGSCMRAPGQAAHPHCLHPVGAITCIKPVIE